MGFGPQTVSIRGAVSLEWGPEGLSLYNLMGIICWIISNNAGNLLFPTSLTTSPGKEMLIYEMTISKLNLSTERCSTSHRWTTIKGRPW